MQKMVAGNWKMNGLQAALGNIAELADTHVNARVQVLICPPATLLSQAVAIAGPVHIGAQDCHADTHGAHTGDISGQMIADCGARAVILGHSERRTDHGETNAMVREKTSAAQAAGLTTIVCIGETLEQREEGKTLSVLESQLADSLPDDTDTTRLVVAYEPVWAIGTGKIPTLDQIREAHEFCRKSLVERFGPSAHSIALLYGGSVKANNADDIFAIENVDGALVGGASLSPSDFSPIIHALEASL